MKQIGYTYGANGWSINHTGPIPATQLFIPEPGTRENINADQFQHVGWVIPEAFPAGTIYETRDQAGQDSRPAYIKRVVPIGFDDKSAPVALRADLAAKLAMRGIHDTHTADAFDTAVQLAAEDAHAATAPVSRAEFEALVLRVDTIAHMLKPPAPPAPDAQATKEIFLRLDGAVNALHARLSTRPSIASMPSDFKDRYHRFVNDIESAANSIRDEVEQLRRVKS